jgi:hypothetical protein
MNETTVTAVHIHMTDDNPHLYYMHFFAGRCRHGPGQRPPRRSGSNEFGQELISEGVWPAVAHNDHVPPADTARSTAGAPGVGRPLRAAAERRARSTPLTASAAISAPAWARTMDGPLAMSAWNEM